MLNVRACKVLCSTIAASLLLSPAVGRAAGDGISKLVSVTQLKAETASTEAHGAAERQRKLVAQRRAQGLNVKLDEEQYRAMRTSAAQIKELEQRLAQIQAQLKAKGCP